MQKCFRSRRSQGASMMSKFRTPPATKGFRGCSRFLHFFLRVLGLSDLWGSIPQLISRAPLNATNFGSECGEGRRGRGLGRWAARLGGRESSVVAPCPATYNLDWGCKDDHSLYPLGVFNGVELNAADQSGCKELILSAKNGHHEFAKWLLSMSLGPDINSRD